MGKLNEAEIQQLRKNENVYFVSANEVRFTEEFKRVAWEEKKLGKSMPEIFREHGVDPIILGHKRIENFIRRLKEQSRNNDDFSDHRIHNNRQNSSKKSLSPEDRIKQLEHELAYIRQEVEFLKKLQMANTEARKEWESKHRQK